ncbi:MAG: hypothetical protein M3442_00870 [Chloroflexota bacterium]|nr:hypothetical protein [Chloroflexota bacterium]
MNKRAAPIDFSQAAPELQRVAEEVHATMQPRSIQKDGEIIAVIMPVASTRTEQAAETGTSEEVRTMEREEMRRRLFAPVSPEELARRQALVKEILAERTTRNIAPLTSEELVRQVREEEYRSYDDRR